MNLSLRTKLLFVGLVVGLPLVALLVGMQISSPSQLAASAKPPTPSTITTKVENRFVGETIAVNGDVVSATSIQVAVSSAAGSTAVVSDVRLKQGDRVKGGDVIVVISGRPVIALRGPVPAYRDLEPGLSGPDVKQLQSALRELRYGTGRDANGAFGPGTQGAIKKLYKDRGFDPQTASSSDVKQTADAETTAQTDNVNTGVAVPSAELLFISDFPATVTQSQARLGAPVASVKDSAPLMTISGGVVSISTTIAADQNSFVHPGTQATVHLTSGESVPASVETVGNQLESTANNSSGYKVSIKPTNALDVALIGTSVSVTIDAAATTSAVLAVPTSAVFSSADGTTHVSKLADGKSSDVLVGLGASAGGWVEVHPKVNGALADGDEVVVGWNGDVDPSKN